MPASQINTTGFYALVDVTLPLWEIRGVGYRPGATIHHPAKLTVIQPVPQQLYKVDANGAVIVPEEEVRTPFEAFLRTLYGAGVSLTSSTSRFNLYEQMVEAGVEGQFMNVMVIDFMATLGAIDKIQVLPDGEQIDLMDIGAGEPRPKLINLKKRDFTLMWNVMNHIGLQGMLPYLFAADGIDFKTFVAKVKEWKQDPAERAEYVYKKLVKVLREAKYRVLSAEEINQFL